MIIHVLITHWDKTLQDAQVHLFADGGYKDMMLLTTDLYD